MGAVTLHGGAAGCPSSAASLLSPWEKGAPSEPVFPTLTKSYQQLSPLKEISSCDADETCF